MFVVIGRWGIRPDRFTSRAAGGFGAVALETDEVDNPEVRDAAPRGRGQYLAPFSRDQGADVRPHPPVCEREVGRGG